MKRMMCLWFPNWPVQWRIIARPSDRNRPLIVHGLSHGGKIRVIASSRAARQRGVAPGMLLAEAQSLWPASAQTTVWFEPHDPLVDRQKLKELALTCQPFSPEVAIDHAKSPDCLLLDVTGREYSFADEKELAEEAIAALARPGYWAVAAIADTIGAAWGVAHCARSKSRVFIILPNRHADALQRLPVEALRLAAPVVQTLRELNIARIGQLLALPRAELPSRFGGELLLAIDRALGTIPETLLAERPSDPLEASWEFEPPVGDGRIVVEVIEHLLERLLGRIPREHSGVKRLLCVLKLIDRQALSLPIELLRPSASQHDLMQLVRLQVERRQIPAEVSGVTVRVAIVARLEFEQDEMFGGDGSRMWKAAAGLLERMSNRLGPKAVVRPRLLPDAQPEFAWQQESWLNGLSSSPLAVSEKEGERLRGWGELGTRPIFLNRPRSIVVVSIFPGGSPRRFQWSDRDYLVERFWGPERIETGWWRGNDVRRDYYIIEATTGERFWLFRNLTDGSWFLHGEFA